ncbi:MAG: tRNA guanosine(34) transglycosylase Tgt [Planctomycetota bacterium]
MSAIRFEIDAQDGDPASRARVGRVTKPHGVFDTPAFMVVGTRGTVKGLWPGMVAGCGAQVVLGNTYHLMLRPGSELVAEMGGLHAWSRWGGAMLTDSGGYQVFSMADINRIDDDGVRFRSHIDGAEINLTPERSMQVQNELGADVIMAFDDCPPAVDEKAAGGGGRGEGEEGVAIGQWPVVGEKEGTRPFHRQSVSAGEYEARLRVANERTVRWLERCVKAHGRAADQALFGIVQGGTDPELRAWCAERVCGFDLPGYAIGGVAVGEGTEEIRSVVEATAPLLPEDRPRYLMGVGYERDIVAAVRAGVDMFDCVLPTRNGRSGQAFTRQGPIKLKNAVHAHDAGPIDPGCGCPACAGGFSRSYIRHLVLSGEMLGPILVSAHNVRHFQRLMLDIRAAISHNAWLDFGRRWPVAAPALEPAIP